MWSSIIWQPDVLASQIGAITHAQVEYLVVSAMLYCTKKGKRFRCLNWSKIIFINSHDLMSVIEWCKSAFSGIHQPEIHPYWPMPQFYVKKKSEILHWCISRWLKLYSNCCECLESMTLSDLPYICPRKHQCTVWAVCLDLFVWLGIGVHWDLRLKPARKSIHLVNHSWINHSL